MEIKEHRIVNYIINIIRFKCVKVFGAKNFNGFVAHRIMKQKDNEINRNKDGTEQQNRTINLIRIKYMKRGGAKKYNW